MDPLDRLKDGQRVTVFGLVAKPEFNERAARVLHFDEESGRYAVELELLDAEGGVKHVSLGVEKPKIKAKPANLRVLEEEDLHVETEDDDTSDRCYLCLRVMKPLTWRGNERALMSCCGNSMCAACCIETQRKRDDALRFQARCAEIQEKDPNWQTTMAEMQEEMQDMSRILQQDTVCALCKGQKPRTPEESFNYVLKHARDGKAWAMCLVAYKYESSSGCKLDLEEAHQWYLKAAAHPEPACNAVAGLGCSHKTRGEYRQAKACLEKAAETNHAMAQYTLGEMYRDGKGVPASAAKAVEWFRAAADEGYHVAQSDLGMMYMKGQGVPLSFQTAYEWLLKSANQGDVNAQRTIAHCILVKNQHKPLEEQIPGFFEARTWARRATQQGDRAAASILQKIESFIPPHMLGR